MAHDELGDALEGLRVVQRRRQDRTGLGQHRVFHLDAAMLRDVTQCDSEQLPVTELQLRDRGLRGELLTALAKRDKRRVSLSRLTRDSTLDGEKGCEVTAVHVAETIRDQHP